jgi:phage-related tail fiber protein
LFAAIGTTFGSGNGSTTFNVPDLRAEFIRGWDNGRGIDTGRVFGSSQLDAFASHTHSITDPGHRHGINCNDTQDGGGDQSPEFGTSDDRYTNYATTGITINATGGAETRPRNVALLPCIKY